MDPRLALHNRHKWKQERFRLDRKKSFSSMRTVKHCNDLYRLDVQPSFLEAFKMVT